MNENLPADAPVREYMMMLRRHREILEHNYAIATLGIFGSFARNEQTQNSDLDVLVSFKPQQSPSLIRYIQIEDALKEILGIKVDLVMEEALRPRIGKRILREVIRL